MFILDPFFSHSSTLAVSTRLAQERVFYSNNVLTYPLRLPMWISNAAVVAQVDDNVEQMMVILRLGVVDGGIMVLFADICDKIQPAR